MKYAKYILRVHRSAANIAILTELGLYTFPTAALKSCHLLDSFIKLKV